MGRIYFSSKPAEHRTRWCRPILKEINMGREAKRVPLDFDWPMLKQWPGYISTHCSTMQGLDKDQQCVLCEKYRTAIGIDPENCMPSQTVEVPTGDGWQMWETTSEGSPISPVFATPQELARWLADTKASAFGDITESYETWLYMIECQTETVSMIMGPDGTKSGVAALRNAEDKPETSDA